MRCSRRGDPLYAWRFSSLGRLLDLASHQIIRRSKTALQAICEGQMLYDMVMMKVRMKYETSAFPDDNILDSALKL